VTQNTFKRWPVGSRGQSAIQASLEARRTVRDVWALQEVRVLTDEAAYDHLVRQRADPWRPTSRETADHALPYIVATAVLDGFVKVESFDPERVLDPRRSQFLVEKVKVAASPEFSKGGKAGFLTRVEIVDGEGRTHVGEAKAPPGHALNPFTEADQEAKFHENVDALFGASRVSEIVAAVRRIDALTDVRELVSLLVVPEPASVD
jgi:2-methylcitrate dehydratase